MSSSITNSDFNDGFESCVRIYTKSVHLYQGDLV